MRCEIVDVFAERPFEGNQLAVVLDAGNLDTASMQTFALETNFSETTFVTARTNGRATVRIFTPDQELPFAGHPTLGTAWVLADQGRDDRITLDLGAGEVVVTFEDGVAWMTPPAVAMEGPIDPVDAAALLSLDQTLLADNFDPCRATVGPSFFLIGVKDLATLRSVTLNDAVSQRLSAGDFVATFAFAEEAYSADAQFAARMFFAAQGTREDPATGSANTAFAQYLKDRGRGGAEIAEQGFEIPRPYRLSLAHRATHRVGGRVRPSTTGAAPPRVRPACCHRSRRDVCDDFW